MMACEQTNTHEKVAQAVAEAMKETIKALAAAGAERSQNAGP